MRQLGGSLASHEVRLLEREASQLLLRDTIGISEQDWHRPSRLPGWSRAHVATHLARNADDFRRITECAISGGRYAGPSPEARFEALERGAERAALDLQIDLDTSAAALDVVWQETTDWHRPTKFLGRVRPLSWLLLARLHEICVHHIDLDIGFTAERIDPAAARWLLAWVCEHAEGQLSEAVAIESESGQHIVLGIGEPKRTVRAGDTQLWAWISGRAPLTDATGITFTPRPLLT